MYSFFLAACLFVAFIAYVWVMNESRVRNVRFDNSTLMPNMGIPKMDPKLWRNRANKSVVFRVNNQPAWQRGQPIELSGKLVEERLHSNIPHSPTKLWKLLQ